MTSLIDVVIATGIFFVSIALTMSFVLSYYSNFQSVLEDSDLRTSAANVNNIFFGGKGVPEDWETRDTTPSRIGLVNDLFRMPVILATTNATDLNNVTLNFTANFDQGCLNRTRENTIRIYNGTNSEFPFTLFNRSFCPGNAFLRSADISINMTMPALSARPMFIYFSPESGINGSNSTYGVIPFPRNVSNYTATIYPIETLKTISPSKLRALRNLTYSQIALTLGSNTRFQLEVDVP